MNNSNLRFAFFIPTPQAETSFACFVGIKKPAFQRVIHGGGRGIRTPGGVTLAGFQDQCIRPLCHSSMQFACAGKYTMLLDSK